MNSKLSKYLQVFYIRQNKKNNDITKKIMDHLDEAIQYIVQEIGTKNWPLVSQLMKERFNLINRSGKQCRQRWYNQLNPQLNKHPWNFEQQEQLFQAHRKYGNRWIQISRQFQGRTDNSIKNHFYSTIRRSMRRICKILGNRNSTSKLRNIRPSILSQIFEFSKTQQISAKQQNQTSSQKYDIASCILEYSKSKPLKNHQFDNQQSKQQLENLVNKLIQLNQQYVKLKQLKRNNHNIKTIQTKTSKNKNNKNLSVNKNKNNKISLEQSVESASTLCHGQIFEKQHRNYQEIQNQLFLKRPFYSNKKQIQIQIQKQNPLEVKFQKSQDEQIQEQKIGDQLLVVVQQQQYSRQIDIESLQDQYLIVKSMPIHFQMFRSIENFNQIENQQFYYVQKPSYHEIIYQDQIKEQSSSSHEQVQMFAQIEEIY